MSCDSKTILRHRFSLGLHISFCVFIFHGHWPRKRRSVISLCFGLLEARWWKCLLKSIQYDFIIKILNKSNSEKPTELVKHKLKYKYLFFWVTALISKLESHTHAYSIPCFPSVFGPTIFDYYMKNGTVSEEQSENALDLCMCS